ncbi:MAG TPA: TIR domain-containing protein [Pyrinomonadaceae bacterium]|jgi:hypothetical protein
MPYDIFISYSHKDNIAGQEEDGWVDVFHQGLYKYLTGYLGRTARIWRDGTKMRGNYRLHQAVFDNLDETLILIPILSPNFLNSEWCPRELNYFFQRNNQPEAMGTRIFPVVKTPIEAPPPEIGDNLLNEFFIRDDFGEEWREIDPAFGGEYKNKFFMAISDLARDIAAFIKQIEDDSKKTVVTDVEPDRIDTTPAQITAPADAAKAAIEATEDIPVIYLAEPSPDLVEQYNDIRRDLEQRRDLGQLKFNFLPQDLTPNPRKPPRADLYIQKISEDIRKARLTVHLIGREYDGFPQLSDKSYLQIQTEVAAGRDGGDAFDRLVWIPRNIKINDDEAHQAFIDEIRRTGVSGDGLMQDSFEEFKSRIIEILENKPKVELPQSAGDTPWVYVLCDKSDFDSVRSLEDALQENNCALLSSRDYLEPALNGDPDINVIETHNEYLTMCDAVLIYWHNARLPWVRKNVFDLQGSKAIRKGRGFRAQGVLCDGNLQDKDKAGFRSPPPKNLFKVEGLSNLPQFFSQLNSNAEA